MPRFRFRWESVADVKRGTEVPRVRFRGESVADVMSGMGIPTIREQGESVLVVITVKESPDDHVHTASLAGCGGERGASRGCARRVCPRS